MGFSEKMRESLGAEGARLDVAAPDGTVAPGTTASAKLTIVGGTKSARIEALTVRVIEADRHWRESDGSRVSEDDASALNDRRHLTAGWDRSTLGEKRINLSQDVEPGARHEIEIPLDVPEACKSTSPCCSHTLNIQADIKGQIDPTGNARIVVGDRAETPA